MNQLKAEAQWTKHTSTLVEVVAAITVRITRDITHTINNLGNNKKAIITVQNFKYNVHI